MQQQEQQDQIIARCLPQLVQRLLDCNEEQKHVDYDACLQYANKCIATCNRPADTPKSISVNLANFIDRFHVESLEELGDTVKLLSQVILDDQQLSETQKWTILNFMLLINYRCFSTAYTQRNDRMAFRSQLLESLVQAYKVKKDARHKQPLELDSDVGSIGGSSMSGTTNLSSLDLSLDLSLLSSTEADCSQPSPTSMKQEAEHNWAEDKLRQEQAEQVARQSFSLAFSQLQLSQQQEDDDDEDNSSIASLPLNEPRPVASFAASFGAYLRRQVENVERAELLYGEEGFLLRELLTMFFQPHDCRHFQLVNHLIQLRPNHDKHQLLVKFLKPLQQMQLLQLFIDCSQRHLETLTCFTAALRRLLKPVVETLTYFEQRVAINPLQATLRCLLYALRPSLPSLQLLWSLAAGSYVLSPQQLAIAPHLRSLHIVSNLLQLAALPAHLDTEEQRGSAAALLLHVLQVYCQFLDSWWLLGDFQDWHNEFPAQLQLISGRSQYVMRPLDGGDASIAQCPIYQIIERHIICAGKSLAVLHDAKRLGHFVGVHRALLKKSLHHMLIKLLLPQLKPYQLEPLKKQPKAPDIFRQLKATDNEQLRAMYHVYYKESLVDFKLPSICTIDALVKQCNSCVSYAPLHELICRSLDRVLEPRVLLVNSFVVHMIREQLQLGQVLIELRSVYLLLDFAQFSEQFELTLDLLETGCIDLASEQLQAVLNHYNSHEAHPFRVALDSADLDQLSLLYSCDAALECIIYKSQLDLYNIAFRRQLQLQVAIRKLQQLPTLNVNAKVCGELQSLKTNLELAMQQHLKMPQLLQAAAECDALLQHGMSLPQLQLAHNTFVQQMCRILLTDNDDEEQLQLLLMLATILAKHWLRLQSVFAISTPLIGGSSCNVTVDSDAQFEQVKNVYLLSINRVTIAMQQLFD